MKKIIICYPYVPHYREPVFSELFDSREYDFELLADDKAFHAAALETIKSSDRSDWKWHRVKNYKIKVFGRELLWQPKALSRVFKSKIHGVILLGDPHYLSNWIILLICKIKGVPSFNWGIGLMRPESNLKWLVRYIYLKLFSGHLLYGNWARNYLLQKGFDKDKIWVVYNSLDYKNMKTTQKYISTKKIKKVRNFIVGDDKNPLIFHSGRLIKRKNIDFIIKALSVLKEKSLKMHLLLVGNGPEMVKLHKYSEKMGVKDQVHFFGSCYDQETIALLISSCDASVAPGQLGLFAIQSLTFGIPVITHNNRNRISGPESESIINNKTGILFYKDDLESFVSCLKDFFSPTFDKDIYKAECDKMIEQFYNPTNQVKIITEALSSSLN